MRSLQAIILAAGEGTRMKSETPKILHTICGRPMIAYAMDLAASSGVKQPIVVLGHGMDAVKPRLPKEAKVVVQTRQRGTGDAVLAAKKLLKLASGPIMVLYADTPLLRRTTVQKLIESHFKTNATCSLMTAHLADPSGYGRITRDENGQISGIVEEAEANAGQRAIREINVGPLICNAQALMTALGELKPSGHKHEIYLTDVIGYLARQEGTKLQATRVEEIAEAFGVNSRAELARAIGVIRQRVINTHLHNGVTIEDPATTFIDQGVSIGADTLIHPYTVIEAGVSIGKRCVIGPFARLREGVSIAEESRVGNFAELVRTKVGPRVRINHVTYLGDAAVDEQANIGAGTITANYDGTEKHPTHVGKGAFIGSDTVLIAPVKVGAGAVTGAGSVVTRSHDVPSKGVVVGVPAHLLDHRAPARGQKDSGKKAAPKSAAAKRNGRFVKKGTATRKATATKSRRGRVRLAAAKRRKPTKRSRPVRRVGKRPVARRMAARKRPTRVIRRRPTKARQVRPARRATRGKRKGRR